MPRLGLMRGFELALRGRAQPIATSAQRVVAFIALHDRPQSRSYIAGMLWGNTSEDRAMGNLRSALWRLRLNDCSVIRAVGDHLSLAPGVVVDVHELARVSKRLLNAPASITTTDVDDLIVAGELLPEWWDEWVLVERERVRQLRLHALERVCEALALAGRFAEAIDAGLAAVTDEPLRESAHRVLIRAHLAEGNRAEALRQYLAYRRLMRSELQLDPSPQITELVAGVGSTAILDPAPGSGDRNGRRQGGG
jgi:DNA-binding SARP family transcriptional activator